MGAPLSLSECIAELAIRNGWVRFNSSVQTLEIQFDLVALAEDKNKDQPHRIDVLPRCNLLMEENSRILCSPLADTDFFDFYVMLHKEDENVNPEYWQ